MKKVHTKNVLPKKAQSWSIDFILGLLIFLLASLISIKIIVNTNPDDEFKNVFDESKFISQTLMSTGYPENWTNQSFVKIGLLTNGKFDESKYSNFTNLHIIGLQSSYYSTKKYLNTQYEYYFFIEDEEGRVLNITGRCGFGYNKVTHYAGPNKIGYYYTNSSVFTGIASAAGYAYTSYYPSGNNLDTLLNNLDQYTILVMENPRLNESTTYPLPTVISYLENWTSKGNTLFLTESINTNISFLNMNFSPTLPKGTGAATVINESFFGLGVPGSILFSDQTTFKPLNPDNYFILAEYPEGPAIATWTFGTGRVYYLSDFASNPSIETGLRTAMIPHLTQFCGQVNLTSIKYENLVPIERIMPLGTGIRKLIIYTWPLVAT